MTSRRYLGRSVVILALLVGSALSACVPRVEEPEIRLTGVRVAGLGLQGGLLKVQLEIVNPNRFGVSTTGLDYEIELKTPEPDTTRWVPLAAGTSDEEVRIGARDTLSVELPVEFRYSALGEALRSVLRTGTFQYRIRGTVDIQEPIRRSLPYRHQGVVTLTES